MSFRRKIVRDLTGQTAFQRRGEQLRRALGPVEAPLATRLGNLWRKEKGSLGVNLVLFAGLAAIGYWWLYPVMWLLPLATWYQLVSRIRNIAEHAVVPDNDDPLRNTRTTCANPLERLLHLEHHLFMFVPCSRLPQAHRALLGAGFRGTMELQPNYLTVLRLATARLADSTGGPGSGSKAQHI